MGVWSYQGVVGLGSGSGWWVCEVGLGEGLVSRAGVWVCEVGLGDGLGSRAGTWVCEVGLGRGPRWCCSPFNGFVLTKALKRLAAIIRS